MTKTRLATLLAATSLALAAPTAAEPRKLALLVGINDYQAVTHLQGCINDVERMRRLLVSKFGFAADDVVVLKDSQATKASILGTFRSHLIDQAAPETIVLIHISAHGSHMTDLSGDEVEDGLDETVVPYDSRQGGVVDIADDDLRLLMDALTAKTRNVTMVVDACHSATSTKGGTLVRSAPDLILSAGDPKRPATRAVGDGGVGLRSDGAPYVLISASAPHELANETFIDGKPYGALSYYLTEALDKLSGEATYREIFDTVAGQVTSRFPNQHPQIEGARADTVLFGERTVTSASHFRVGRSGSRLIVDGGAIHGLTVGSQLDVYAPTVRAFQSPNLPIARITLTRVDDFSSEATSQPPSPAPPIGSRAVLRSANLPPSRLRVYYCSRVEDKPTECNAASAALDAVRAAAARTALVDEAATGPEAQMIVEERAGFLHLLFGDFSEASSAIDAREQGFADVAADRLSAWAKWHALLALSNPGSSLPITLAVTRPHETTPVTFVPSGETARLSVTNGSTVPLYFTVLDISSVGSIQVLAAPIGGAPYGPGRTLETTLKFTVPAGRTSVTDTIKVLATAVPINASVFEQAAVYALPDNEPLARAFDDAFQGNKAATVVPQDSWTVASTPVRVGVSREVPPGVEAFAVHLPEGTRTLDPATRGVFGDCSVTPTDCWDAEPLGPSGTFVFRPHGARRPDGGVASFGAAWEAAYRLRRDTGAIRVEPLLDVDSRGWNDEESGTRSAGPRPDKAAAASDATWSLKHAAVDTAWRLLQDKGAVDGEEAKGIRLASVDTGFRRHQETWNADPARNPILASSGYDFLDNDPDAEDELDTGGLLAHPGHGTKSGSVIASPKGRQMEGGPPTEFVSGVAPGARLIPLRVNRSVVHLSTGNMARAIAAAAGDDRSLVKERPDIISISMGGLPGWALWKAVRFARDRGVIVVAAAGNEVKTVVWPGRFKEVVGVAASNVECAPWAGSSHGGAVDITAPGESVWRASTDPPGIDSIGMGQGTTFATATVAGVAALWLAYHRDAEGRDDPEMTLLKREGRVTAAFLDLLRRTAWRPDQPETKPENVSCAPGATWNTSEYAAGIVNAAGILRAPLPLGPRDEAPAHIEELPLFATLFPDDTPLADVQNTYFLLLPSTGRKAAATGGEFEGEITGIYAVDPEAADAIDHLVRERTPASAAAVRTLLLQKDISPTLRATLSAVPVG